MHHLPHHALPFPLRSPTSPNRSYSPSLLPLSPAPNSAQSIAITPPTIPIPSPRTPVASCAIPRPPCRHPEHAYVLPTECLHRAPPPPRCTLPSSPPHASQTPRTGSPAPAHSLAPPVDVNRPPERPRAVLRQALPPPCSFPPPCTTLALPQPFNPMWTAETRSLVPFRLI